MLLVLKVPLRRAARRPFLTLGIVLLLAVPIAATLIALAFVNGVVLKPLPFPDHRQLTSLTLLSPDGSALGFTGPDFITWRQQARAFADLAAYDEGGAVVQSGTFAERVDGAEVSANLLGVLQVTPVIGRFLLPDEDRIGGPAVIVIGHQLWQRVFGGAPDVVGRTLRVGGTERQIVGVMDPRFSFPRVAEYWTPIWQDPTLTDRLNFDVSVVGRLAPGRDIALAISESRNLVRRLAFSEGDRAGYAVEVESLQSVLVGQDLGDITFALTLAAALLVGLAGVSVGGVLIGDALNRRREISIRAALGARSRDLLAPFAIEATVLWMIAAGAALVIAAVAKGITQEVLPRDIAILLAGGWDWRVLGAGVAVCLLFAMTLGIGSGVWLLARTRWSPSAMTMRRESHMFGFHDGILFVTTIATTLLLVLGSTALNYVRRITNARLGFEPSGVTAATYQVLGRSFERREQRVALAEQALRLTGMVPNVQRVGGATRVPGLGAPLTVAVEPRDRPGPTVVHFSAITSGLFETLAIRIRAGRDFEPQEHTSAAPRVAIVSTSLARRFFPDGRAVGQYVRVGAVGAPPPVSSTSNVVQIVGVVDDVRDTGFEGEIASMVYTPLAYFPAYYLTIVATGIQQHVPPAALGDALRPLGADVVTFRASRLDEAMSDAIWRPVAVSWGLSLAALTALAIALGGIATSVHFRATSRRRELAIRVAVGASPANVLLNVTGRPALLTTLGAVLGVLIGVASARLVPGASTDGGASNVFVVILIVTIGAGSAMILPVARLMRAGFWHVLREET